MGSWVGSGSGNQRRQIEQLRSDPPDGERSRHAGGGDRRLEHRISRCNIDDLPNRDSNPAAATVEHDQADGAGIVMDGLSAKEHVSIDDGSEQVATSHESLAAHGLKLLPVELLEADDGVDGHRDTTASDGSADQIAIGRADRRGDGFIAATRGTRA